MTCRCFSSYIENVSPQWGSNSRPLVYETSALATELWRLQHERHDLENCIFKTETMKLHSVTMISEQSNIHIGQPFPPQSIWRTIWEAREKKIFWSSSNHSPQWGSNSRPLVYKTSALTTELWRLTAADLQTPMDETLEQFTNTLQLLLFTRVSLCHICTSYMLFKLKIGSPPAAFQLSKSAKLW